MPEEGIDLSPVGKILTNEEVLRLASLFVRNGITKIRLTGGEPTVRKDITELIRAFVGRDGIQSESHKGFLFSRGAKCVEASWLTIHCYD